MRMVLEIAPGRRRTVEAGADPAQWARLHDELVQAHQARGCRVRYQDVLACRYAPDPGEVTLAPETLVRQKWGDCEDFTIALRVVLWWLPSRSRFEQVGESTWHVYPEFWFHGRWRPLDISGFSQLAIAGARAPALGAVGESFANVPLGPFETPGDVAVATLRGIAHGIPPWVIWGLVEYESGGRQSSASPCCCGLLQLHMGKDGNGKGQSLETFNRVAHKADTAFVPWKKVDVCSDTPAAREKNLIVGVWHLARIAEALRKAGALTAWDEPNLQRLFIAWNAGWSQERGFLRLWELVQEGDTGDGVVDALVNSFKAAGNNVRELLLGRRDLNALLLDAAQDAPDITPHLADAKRWAWAGRAAKKAVKVHKATYEQAQGIDWADVLRRWKALVPTRSPSGGGGLLVVLALLAMSKSR